MATKAALNSIPDQHYTSHVEPRLISRIQTSLWIAQRVAPLWIWALAEYFPGQVTNWIRSSEFRVIKPSSLSGMRI